MFEKLFVPRNEPQREDVVVVSYFPMSVYADNKLIAQDGHTIISQQEIGNHTFRQVSTSVYQDDYPIRSVRSTRIANYILIKKCNDPDYTLVKNRRFGTNKLKFHTLRDFEDMMGLR